MENPQGSDPAGSNANVEAGSGDVTEGAGAPQNPYQPTDWRHGVFPSLAGDEKAVRVLDKFKEPTAAIKSLVELESFVGSSVRIPKADAKPEEVRAFHRKLGCPASAADYRFERPQLPEGVSIAPEVERAILQTAHEAGLTGKQVEHFFNGTAKATIAEAERARVAREAAEIALRREWGAEYDNRMDLVRRAVEFMRPEIRDFLSMARMADGTLLGNHPAMFDLLFARGLASQEARWVEGAVDGITSPDVAAVEVAKLMKHPAYFDSSRPEHKEIVAKVNRLQKLRFGVAAPPEQ